MDDFDKDELTRLLKSCESYWVLHRKYKVSRHFFRTRQCPKPIAKFGNCVLYDRDAVLSAFQQYLRQRLWTTKEIAALSEMKSSGMEWPKISSTLGRSIGACKQKWSSHEIQKD